MMMFKEYMAAFLIGFLAVCGYYTYAFADWSQPYHRIFGLVTPEAPVTCGQPSGPTPDVIRVGGCNRQEWTVERERICNVTPSDPVVRRWIIDRDGRVTLLPVILSEQVNGVVPRMSKTFIQPPVPPGWVSYHARVCLECPTNAFLMRGRVNPFHRLIKPVCIDELSTEYRVEADGQRGKIE